MRKYRNTSSSKINKKIHLEIQSGSYQTLQKTSREADCGCRNTKMQIQVKETRIYYLENLVSIEKIRYRETKSKGLT